MASSGLLGALSGAGQGVAKVGEILMKDDLETVRQERLAKIQGERDEKLFGQKKELTQIEQDYKSGEMEKDRELKSSEGMLDRQNKMDIAQLDAETRKQVAADKVKATDGKPSGSFKKYSELKGMGYPDDWAIGVAYSGFKTTTDPRTKEMILLGPSKEKDGGFVELGRMAPSDPEKRRSPKVWKPNPEENKSGMLSEPTTPPLDPGKFARVKGDYSGYKDGQYKTSDGKVVTVVGGVAYLEK